MQWGKNGGVPQKTIEKEESWKNEEVKTNSKTDRETARRERRTDRIINNTDLISEE